VIELLPEDAPKTVAHFLDLVDRKFYDGILFHRYVRFFVAQAGDPKSKEVQGKEIANLPWEEAAEKFKLGEGGSGKTVPLEARRKHEWGTLGMARDNNPDSGDSQFFFNLTDNTRLDQRMPGYCVFGRVVRGLDVMDSIRQGDKIVSIRRTEAKDKDQ
jgi:cyclophilin family peptidyl-prolyl cis-trans isomerase